MGEQLHRKIIHIDMDAFYASVEQLDNPDYVGKPLAVGGNKIRGVISAASYEARKFGVRSAMSCQTALKLCPNLILVKPRFDRYKEISLKMRNIFLEYTDLVEPVSLDEAYLDVTFNKKNNPSASIIAREIRNKIYNKTGLTASAGISYNKFLAKIASDFNKPNGQKTITPKNAIPFLDNMSIRKFHGIGEVTADKMYMLGIFNGKDLRDKSIEYLKLHFGNSAEHYYQICRGIHNSPVVPYSFPKSMGAERTFTENLTSEIFIERELSNIASEVERRLVNNNIYGKTVTLKIKYSDFKINTRSYTSSHFVNKKQDIMPIVKELLYKSSLKDSVRLLGITVSKLVSISNIEEDSNCVQLYLEFPPRNK